MKKKSKANNKQEALIVTKNRNIGLLPKFIQLGHRGLEKSAPAPIVAGRGFSSFNVPVDIIGLSISDQSLTVGIESLTFNYKKSVPGTFCLGTDLTLKDRQSQGPALTGPQFRTIG